MSTEEKEVKEEEFLDLIRQLRHDGEYRNLSKTTKPILAATLSFVIKKCSSDAMDQLEAALEAELSVDLSDSQGGGDSRDDLFLSQEETQFSPSTSKAAEQTTPVDGEDVLTRPKGPVCRDRYKGKSCSDPGRCEEENRAHPTYCTIDGCTGARCGMWHVIPKARKNSRGGHPPAPKNQGNGRKGSGRAPLTQAHTKKPKSGKGKSPSVEVLRLRAELAEAARRLAESKEKATKAKYNSWRDAARGTLSSPPRQRLGQDASQPVPSSQQQYQVASQPVLSDHGRDQSVHVGSSGLAKTIAQAVAAALAAHYQHRQTQSQ